MEISWKILCWCMSLLFCQLCNGLPINLETTAADSHTQLLTGLVAFLLTICSVVFLAGCLCCQRRNGFKEFRDSPVVASASTLDHGHINPVANGEFTIFTPLSPPHQNNNVFLANQQIITRTQEDYVSGDVDVSSWFNGTETDFPRIKLKYIKEIGKGWFGRVVEGAAQGSDQNWTPVVVRILDATASRKERVVFLHDASIYRNNTHPNILQLFGRCLDTVPLLLLQEYCPQGDLKSYLLLNKSTPEKLLTTEYPLIWCCQLSAALRYLHEKKLIHPDLAARNCQLTENLTLKLGDYGLAVFRYPDDYYEGAPSVPVRWCAPESVSYTSTTIQPKKTTLEANVWSFGVTLWEIWECGEQPYSSMTDDEVVSLVLGSQNVRLSRPKYQILYTDYIFHLMQMCWTNSESRPPLHQIDLMLGDLLQVYKNTSSTQSETFASIKDFDNRWESFKPNNIVKTDNHFSDSTETDLEETEIVVSKPLSPSLNNLHGSLDNLLGDGTEVQMESWLENVANRTGDMSFVRGLSDAIKDLDNAIALENSLSSDSGPVSDGVEFKLGPVAKSSSSQNQDEGPWIGLYEKASSGSETEEENWKTKIERGAYSEKVRQKSRSVADLMVLTHIDQSESEPETPLPSLDYRTNYKNVRYAPKNLENVSLMFGSEGNLLSVQDTFQAELKKLQEERRDSLLFVPENCSQDSSENLLSDSDGRVGGNCYFDDSPSKRILQELNSTAEIKPVNQVFNVFNVTIDPVQLQPKLSEFINFRDECSLKDKYQVPKLADIIQSNSELVDYLITNKDRTDFVTKSLSDDENDNSEALYDSGVEGDKMESTESLRNLGEDKCRDVKEFLREDVPDKLYQVPKLMDLIQDNDELMDYIITRYEAETLGRSNENLDSLENCDNAKDVDQQTQTVDFDLSESQDEVMPNSLTHSSLCTSTPFCKKSLQEVAHINEFTSLNLFDNQNQNEPNAKLYSLETWDRFLGKTLDNQNESQENELFDSFSSEPQSLLFTENEVVANDVKSEESESQETVQDKTYARDAMVEGNMTYLKDDSVVDVNDINLTFEPEGNVGDSTFVTNSGGWFLHPQSNSDATGEMVLPSGASTDSYVGFNVDDEIMAAIRTELLNKLPQAQGGSGGTIQDEEEWESIERNEVFLRYNVYNTPLSPIPEETYTDDTSYHSPIRERSDSEHSDSDEEALPQDTESPVHVEHPHRHTPSQDSCCSNDTLFNLEELTCTNELDKEANIQSSKSYESDSHLVHDKPPEGETNPNLMTHKVNNESASNDAPLETSHFDNHNLTVINPECRASENANKNINNIDKQTVVEFLTSERQHDCSQETSEESSLLLFLNPQQVAPLPSPEDKPWKQLPASLLSFDTQNMLITTESNKSVPESHEMIDKNEVDVLYVNVSEETEVEGRGANEHNYENITNIDDFFNEADYVNIENAKNSADFVTDMQESEVIEDGEDRDSSEYDQSNTLIINNGEEERDIFGVLTDIRFNGPGDQLMSTSFSESNDLNDEQDWDSGSDTRSSSSGEFIWKEGEHEESLKALRAAPQDVLEDLQPMNDIQEETSSESTDTDDEEGESPEFVPSAWDKYATPTKSAMRSPEKTLEKTEQKKAKGVWFKKQKYHCVYEYPREPESPVLHSYDLWKPQSNFGSFDDWDLDGTEPSASHDNSDDSDPSHSYYQVRPNRNLNAYQLSGVADFCTNDPSVDDEFFISSSAKPFDMLGSLSSQFFPGNWSEMSKHPENMTPDSGVEDITPGGSTESDLSPQQENVKSLKQLASEAVKNTKSVDLKSDALGGLRHTRNKLKLDLPPSPSAFTSSKVFNIEPEEDVIHREKPTFTTFGKSRFIVQHVETPPDEVAKSKNVSFEALPYKPLHKQILREDYEVNESRGKVEIVRGEASLLDSGDEDSGIESSTLERKLSSTF